MQTLEAPFAEVYGDPTVAEELTMAAMIEEMNQCEGKCVDCPLAGLCFELLCE